MSGPCHHAPSSTTSLGGTMRTTTSLLAATAAALLALTGCSSNGSDDAKPSAPAATTAADEPTTTPTPDAGAGALEQAVKAYTAAYFKGDAKTAYGTLSKRCTKAAPEALFAATIKDSATDYGPDHAATDVHADVSGTLARVSYKVVGLPKFDQQAQPWTREGGVWKYDAC